MSDLEHLIGDMISICKKFESLVERHFNFLYQHGFERSSKWERVSSTGCVIAYLGKYIAITVSYDYRDNLVGTRVVKVDDGNLIRNQEDGFASGLHMYLVRYAGYSDDASIFKSHEVRQSMELMVQAWANLLKNEGKMLLEDMPDTLPR